MLLQGTNIKCDETCCGHFRTVAKLRGTAVELMHEHHGTKHLVSLPIPALLRMLGTVR